MDNKGNIYFTDIKVFSTGIIPWLFLTLASLKLCMIYSPNPAIAYFTTYNLLSVLFLLYFYVYLNTRFNFKVFFILFIIFNLGIQLLDVFYNHIILIYPLEMNTELFFFSSFINFIFMSITYLFLIKVLKYYKR